MENLPPLIGEHPHRTGRSSLPVTDHTNLYAIDAGLLHGLQIFHDALARDIAVHPIPVHGQGLLVGRVTEILFQGVDGALRLQLKTPHHHRGDKRPYQELFHKLG